MSRLLLLIVAGLFSLAAAAVDLGNAEPPTQQQLRDLLSGNTLAGEWDGRRYTQHFAANRTTRYREGDGAVTQGTWRITADGLYCSVWPPSPTEACYVVLVDGDRILWKSGDRIFPSTVIEGDHF